MVEDNVLCDSYKPLAKYSDLLKVEDVAEVLGVSERTVYRLADSGDLPCVRVGHRIYFTRAAMIERLGLTA